MARRQYLIVTVALCLAGLLGITFLMSSTDNAKLRPQLRTSEQASFADGLDLTSNVFTGGAIAPKLGNETAKAELGRATWKFLHTMVSRFPDEPSADDSLALQTFITLMARLYPCGECAAHFQKLLKKYPVQTSSRNAAAGWACMAHNQVNKRLKKPMFDCNNIGDFYDCGCAEDKDGKKIPGSGKAGVAVEGKSGKEEPDLRA